jgi:hypothetical protein
MSIARPPRRSHLQATLIAAITALSLLCGAATQAARADERGADIPDWAKPYARSRTPEGSYIASGDRWIILRNEILIGHSERGGIRRTYRQVLKPNTDAPAELMLTVTFNEAAQQLDGPEVWVPKGLRHRNMDIAASSLDVPLLQGSTITAMRSLLVSSEPIRPGRRNVIATWTVEDTETFPGEDAILPLEAYPVVEFHVRAEDERVRLTFVDADGTVSPVPAEGITLREIPAAQHLFVDEQNPWLGSVLSSVPFIHASAHDADAHDWQAVADRTRGLFDAALAADQHDTVYIEQTRRLTAGIEATEDRIGVLAQFAQSLTYRDIQWGLGAFLPEPPGQVLRSRSADCKGKTLLLQAMLAQIGVRSTPVLVNIDDYFQDYRAPASPLAFNHVVLAIDAPDGDALPGRLTAGPGTGWVLFDPTDPLATYGLPTHRVSGRAALWLDAPGTLFTIEQAGDQPLETLTLDLAVDVDGDVQFTATITGPGEYSYHMADHAVDGVVSERFRRREASRLREQIPGIELTEAHYQAPSHQDHEPMRVRLGGTIPSAMRPLAGSLKSMDAPMRLLGYLIGLPVSGIDYTPPRRAVGVPVGWKVDPCCEAHSHRLQAQVTMRLPPSWQVTRAPAFAPVDNAWLSARVETSPLAEYRNGDRAQAAPGWQVDIAWRRGRFPDQRPEDRAAELNRVAGVFHQAFLIDTASR